MSPPPSLARALPWPVPSGRRPRPGAAAPRRTRPERSPIGALLVARGALDPGDLARALALQAREDVRLGEILLTHGLVSETELVAALADQWNARIVDLAAAPPDPRLIDRLGPETCLGLRLVPWRRIGAATVVATARPEEFARHRPEIEARLGPVLMAVAPERDVLAALVSLRSRRLARRAETRVPEAESCRLWDGRRFRRRILATLGLAAAGLALAPAATFALLTFVALLAMAGNTALRVGAIVAHGRRRRAAARARTPTGPPPAIARLPMVSLLVPLYRETEIAGRLVRRLGRLSYPRELLDICLVTEEDDTTTREALAAARLPRWLRVIVVPAGGLRTKPRAMNYALDFCRGSIIGIYDAEDAPEPDQIHRIVRRFHERGPEVACLQGVLDFYNARSNWMARAFALEYAAWFRVILPGLEHMGLAVPLGGTTVFLRRAALEALGGWDAHNVTEDADLGIRLARHGYRTEVVPTVTGEEANARPWPWIRQRSRWLKGYAMTWAVHMRDPRRLWRELGPRRFLGVQVLFGGTLASFLLAPVLWSYWLVVLDLPHPLGNGAMPGWAAAGLAGLFILAWAVNLAVLLIGASAPEHRHLRPWAATLGLYFPLATLAAIRGIVEMVARPFHWDKTQHGLDDADAPEGLAPSVPRGWAVAGPADAAALSPAATARANRA